MILHARNHMEERRRGKDKDPQKFFKRHPGKEQVDYCCNKQLRPLFRKFVRISDFTLFPYFLRKAEKLF